MKLPANRWCASWRSCTAWRRLKPCPNFLREIMEVGKVAIVAEAGVLWLSGRKSRGDLVRVVPSPMLRRSAGRWAQAWAGQCAQT